MTHEKHTANVADLFGELLSSFIEGRIEIHRLDPNKPFDAQVDAIAEKVQQEHEKHCTACRAQREDTEAAPATGDAAATGRRVVGYMAFNERDGEPIVESFSATREKVAEGRERFLKQPVIALLKSLGVTPGIVIRPVYVD